MTQREPRNITRGENENQVVFPCPYYSQELAPPIWRINGTDYTSATLPSIFSLDSNRLYISEVHKCLDQTSFQCIDTSDSGLQGRESNIGTLTVTLTSGGCTSEHTILYTHIIKGPDLDSEFYGWVQWLLVLNYSICRVGEWLTTAHHLLLKGSSEAGVYRLAIHFTPLDQPQHKVYYAHDDDIRTVARHAITIIKAL